jgi:phage-related holin
MEQLNSLRIEVLKAVLSIVPAGYFVFTGQMQEAVFTFGLFLTLDTITGWVKSTGWFCGGFVSTKLVNMKKIICYMLAILLAFPLSHLPYFDWSFIYVVGWLSLREAWSIMENLSDMGLPMPQKIVETVRGELIKSQNKI